MLRRIRLISGVVLLVYVALHLANHSLGLISLQALESGRDAFLAIWRNPLGTVILYGALLIHVGLALWALFERQSLRMRLVDWVQVVLGFSIPLVLFVHILGTRLAHELYGVQDSYAYELLILYLYLPGYALRQAVLLCLAWGHGCLGIHMWLRLKPWYQRWRWLLFTAALLLPTLSLAGFWVGGRDIMRLAQDPAWLAEARATINFASADQVEVLRAIDRGLLAALAAFLALALAIRPLKERLRRRLGKIEVCYLGGRRVTIAQGTTVLEASRQGGIAHASVCGGRGRCSTCRIRISAGLEAQPEAGPEEQRVLQRVRANPNVRLACQLRPVADLEVTPLLSPESGLGKAFPQPAYLQGQERDIVVLFADLRGFTSLSEHKLPYDVVFVLNRYFAAMGKAIESAGGRVDKFIGDGVMALFGVEGGLEAGSRDALSAVRGMAQQLEVLNESLRHDLEQPLRIGIGVHAGPVILGEMGYGSSVSVTAIGDTVNTASRLEALTKDFAVQLILSETLAEAAGLDCARFLRQEIDVRGRKERLAVHLIDDAREIAEPAR
jgi:adenylate cyclase